MTSRLGQQIATVLVGIGLVLIFQMLPIVIPLGGVIQGEFILLGIHVVVSYSLGRLLLMKTVKEALEFATLIGLASIVVYITLFVTLLVKVL